MANEKFKVKFGLAVGDTAATVDGTTGDINTNGSALIDQNLQVNGATTLGNAPADIVSINGDTLINNALTIGSSTGDTVTVNSQVAGNIAFSDNSTTTSRGVTGTVGTNDYWKYGGGATGANSGYAEIATGDDGTEPIYARQYSGGSIAKQFTLMDSSGNTQTAGDLTVNGNGYIYSATGLALDLTGADVSVAGDLTVLGGDISVPTATANIANTTATTVNIAGAATTVSIGAGSGNTTVNNDLRVLGNDISGNSGTPITLAGNNLVVNGDLEVRGGDITTNQTSFNLLNTTATTVNIAGAATAVSLGNAAGTVTIPGNLTVNGTTTTVNTQDLLVKDNKITLNYGATGTPPTSLRSGIEIARGTSPNVAWQWNELQGWWEADGGTGSTEQNIWAAGNIVSGTSFATNGVDLTFNNDDGAASNTTIKVKKGSGNYAAIRYNATSNRWESTVDNGVTWIEIPDQDLDTTSSPTFLGANVNKTLSVGGTAVDASGYVNYYSVGGLGLSPVGVFVDNTNKGQFGRIVVRDYGNHDPGQSPYTGTTTQGTAILTLEGVRGNATTKTAAQTNGQIGSVAFSSYDGTNFISQATGAPVNAMVAFASENYAAASASFTASISGFTMTVTAVASGVLAPGMMITSGAAAGTSITAMGNNTAGGTGTYTVNFSQTVSSTSMTGYQPSNAGSYTLFNNQLQATRFSQDARQPWLRTSMTGASGINSPYMTINMGAAPVVTASDRLIVNSAGTTYWRDYGRTLINVNNSLLNINGVPSTDTAVVTGYIDNNSTPGTYSGVAGNKLTVTAVTSGILSPGQLVTGTGVTQLTFITAQDSGTTGGVGVYSVSTNLATAGQAVPSTTITTYPDNASLLGSNNLYITSSRKSGLGGRRRGIRNGDRIGGMFVNATYDDSGNTSTTGVAAFRFQATETFNSGAQGTQFTLQTTKNGTNIMRDTIVAGSTSTTFASDAYYLTDSSNVAVTSAAVNYTRTYGEFACVTTTYGAGIPGFNIPAQNTVYTMPLDSTFINSGVTISGTGSININVAGTYKLIMSLQAAMATNSVGQFDFWLRKNGVDVANSKTQVDLLKDQKSVIAMDWMVSSNGSDYFEIVYASSSANYANIAFPTIAATTTPYASPLAPALILNVIPIGM